MKWLNASDIKNWVISQQRHCQETLPELIRRLIIAHTGNVVEHCEFLIGDSVSIKGWDGILKTTIISPFFPTGTSGWEISTEKLPQNKAETDYNKRTKDPLGLSIQDTTFVFVTPHAWPLHTKWESELRDKRIWKDIRVIDQNALENWIESTPAVASWLAHEIGKTSTSIRDLESIWEEWALATKPTMTSDLVIGGRTSEMKKIQDWLEAEPSVLEVEGDHPSEVLAFLYASITNLPETKRIQCFVRCVVVDSINDMRQTIEAFNNVPLIIAATGECIDLSSLAVKKKHHVLIIVDMKVKVTKDIFRLSHLKTSAANEILKKIGIPETQAQQFTRDSGHSLTILRRLIFASNAVRAPVWTEAKPASILIPALFAGSWDERREGDRQVLELLTGMDYNTFIRELTPLLLVADSPIRKVGFIWMIKSLRDAWFLLASQLTQETLERFKQVLLTILIKLDPKYELEPEQRRFSPVFGKQNPESEYIRRGLVRALIILALYGNRTSIFTPMQAIADEIVSQVFTSANKWELWASLKDETPLLAEASPDGFLEVVGQAIRKNPIILQELMKDDQIILGECKHSGLIWALESIAWSSEYFSGTVSILANLAKIDPGGRWRNRPVESLKDIFRPKLPQTYAKPQERLDVLDKLIATDPQLVWKFAHSYLGGDIVMESYRFRWRDSGGEHSGLEPEPREVDLEYLTGLLPKLKDLACKRENLLFSLSEFNRLPKDIGHQLLFTLENTDPEQFTKDERTNLLEKIRGILHWIYNYGDEKKRANLLSLNRILDKFTPEDVVERTGWLFTHFMPELPQKEPRDYDSKVEIVSITRERAARDLLDKIPMENILEYSKTLQYPDILGYSLGKIVRDDKEDISILNSMLKNVGDNREIIQGYARGRVKVAKIEWIDLQIQRMKTEGAYSPVAHAYLYLSLPESAEIWSAVRAGGNEVETVYWNYARGLSQTNKTQDAAIAVEKLLDAKRPEAALQIAGDLQVSIPSLLLQRILQDIARLGNNETQRGVISECDLGQVFNQLYRKNELSLEELGNLELPFALIFENIKEYTSFPMALHRILQKDPQFFALLIAFSYKQDDKSIDQTHSDLDEKTRVNRSRNAQAILESWGLVPGFREEGSIDERELIEWVAAAREQYERSKCIIGGDIEIAHMLVNAPGDPDGMWPHIAVRNLLERLSNDDIERHIEIEILNRRGAFVRDPNEGGRQEKELAGKYWKMSNTIKIKWPRMGKIFATVAKSYEENATHEDYHTDILELSGD